MKFRFWFEFIAVIQWLTQTIVCAHSINLKEFKKWTTEYIQPPKLKMEIFPDIKWYELTIKPS